MKREYILTNGNKFIKRNVNGKYQQVNNIGLADIYETQRIASNVMLYSMPKSWSRSYYVAEIVEGKIVQCNVPRPPKVNKTISGYCYEKNISDMQWCEGFDKINRIFDDSAKRTNELSQELSDINNQIVDIEHFIEFHPLNARDGYKVYRKLRELLCSRRRLKNEQYIVNEINRNRSAYTQISNILKVIEECKNQRYTPRILIDLFKNGISAIT